MLKWSQIAKLARNKLLLSSYIWIAVVPVLAKATSTLSDPIIFTALGPEIEIRTSLPFSLKVFYFAALLSGLSNIIFEIMCPDIIKFGNFGKFNSSGLGIRYLNGVVKSRNLHSDLSQRSQQILEARQSQGGHIGTNDTSAEPSDLYTIFWDIYYRCSEANFRIRLVCTSLFVCSLILLLCVVAQNALYVILKT